MMSVLYSKRQNHASFHPADAATEKGAPARRTGASV